MKKSLMACSLIALFTSIGTANALTWSGGDLTDATTNATISCTDLDCVLTPTTGDTLTFTNDKFLISATGAENLSFNSGSIINPYIITATGLAWLEGAVSLDEVVLNSFELAANITSNQSGVYIYGNSVLGDIDISGIFNVYNNGIDLKDIKSDSFVSSADITTTNGQGIYFSNANIQNLVNLSGDINVGAYARGILGWRSTFGSFTSSANITTTNSSGLELSYVDVDGAIDISGTINASSAGIELAYINADSFISSANISSSNFYGINLGNVNIIDSVNISGTLVTDSSGVYLNALTAISFISNANITSTGDDGLNIHSATLQDVNISGSITAYNDALSIKYLTADSFTFSGVTSNTGSGHGVYLGYSDIENVNVFGEITSGYNGVLTEYADINSLIINSDITTSNSYGVSFRNSDLGAINVAGTITTGSGYAGVYTMNTTADSFTSTAYLANNGIYLGSIDIAGAIDISGTINSGSQKGFFLSGKANSFTSSANITTTSDGIYLGGSIENSVNVGGVISSKNSGLYLYNAEVGEVFLSGSITSSAGYGLNLYQTEIANAINVSGTLNSYKQGIYLNGDVQTGSGIILSDTLVWNGGIEGNYAVLTSDSGTAFSWVSDSDQTLNMTGEISFEGEVYGIDLGLGDDILNVTAGTIEVSAVNGIETINLTNSTFVLGADLSELIPTVSVNLNGTTALSFTTSSLELGFTPGAFVEGSSITLLAVDTITIDDLTALQQIMFQGEEWSYGSLSFVDNALGDELIWTFERDNIWGLSVSELLVNNAQVDCVGADCVLSSQDGGDISGRILVHGSVSQGLIDSFVFDSDQTITDTMTVSSKGLLEFEDINMNTVTLNGNLSNTGTTGKLIKFIDSNVYNDILVTSDLTSIGNAIYLEGGDIANFTYTNANTGIITTGTGSYDSAILFDGVNVSGGVNLSGVISAYKAGLSLSDSTVGTLTSSTDISSSNYYGIQISESVLETINLGGTLSGSSAGLYVLNSTVDTFNITGTVTGTSDGLYLYNTQVTTALNILGEINASSEGVYVNGANTSINAAVVDADITSSGSYGVFMSAGSVTNTLEIGGTINSASEAIYLSGEIELGALNIDSNITLSSTSKYGVKLEGPNVAGGGNLGDVTVAAVITAGGGVSLERNVNLNSFTGNISLSSTGTLYGYRFYSGVNVVNEIVLNGTVSSAGTAVYLYDATAGSITVNGLISSSSQNGFDLSSSVINGDVLLNDISYNSRGVVFYQSELGGDLILDGDISSSNTSSYQALYIYSGTSIAGNIMINGDMIHDSYVGSRSNSQLVYLDASTVDGNFTNNGILRNGTSYGMMFSDSSIGGAFVNTGEIESLISYGMYIDGTSIAGGIVNSGLIKSNNSSWTPGLYITGNSEFNFINELGAIIESETTSQYGAFTIEDSVFVGNITNYGLISSTNDGINFKSWNENEDSITGDVINSGTVYGDHRGLVVMGYDFNGSITNSGTISATTDSSWTNPDGGKNQTFGIFILEADIGNIENTATGVISGQYGVGLSAQHYDGDMFGRESSTNDTDLTVVNNGSIIGSKYAAIALDFTEEDGDASAYDNVLNYSGFGTLSGATVDIDMNGGTDTLNITNANIEMPTMASVEIVNISDSVLKVELNESNKSSAYPSVVVAAVAQPVSMGIIDMTSAESLTLSNVLFDVDVDVISYEGNHIILLEVDSITADTSTLGISFNDVSFSTSGFFEVHDAGDGMDQLVFVFDDPKGAATVLAPDQPVSGAHEVMGVLSVSAMSNAVSVTQAIMGVVQNNQQFKRIASLSRGNAEFAFASELRSDIQSIFSDLLDAKSGVWVQGFGQFDSYDGKVLSNGISSMGYDSSNFGLTFGYDHHVSNNVLLGLATSYVSGDVKGTGDSFETTSDTLQFNFYGSYTGETFYFDGILGYGLGIHDQTRNTGSDIASADYYSSQFSAQANLGHVFFVNDNFTLTPYGKVVYMNVTQDSYEETDSVNALSMEEVEFRSFQMGGGLEAGYIIRDARSYWMPRMHVEYALETQKDSLNVNSTVLSTGLPGTPLATPDMGDQIMRAGLGVTYVNEAGHNVSLDFEMEDRDNYSSHSIFLKGKWMF